MQETAGLGPGFEDPVHEAQSVFRACLDALSRPAVARSLSVSLDGPEPMYPTSAAILLALADYETTIWLDAGAAATGEVGAYLRFHTGARLTDRPEAAQFALVTEPERMPPLTTFNQGEPEYPDRSTTLIVQASRFDASDTVWAGPGIRGQSAFTPTPMPTDWRTQLADNRARFPLGVDLILVTRNAIAGLPRSTREVSEGL